jgi:repressor LexA
MGTIAAGRPLLAEQQIETIDFAPLFESENHFCLRVNGDSMIEDQIADGDYVVVSRQDTCESGEIVVALVDGHDATLKRFYLDAGRVRLEPANAALQPTYPSRVEVIGVVVGVIRKY